MQEEAGEEAEYNETGATDVLYCICQTNAQGWMIACDGGCEYWFHEACVNLKEEDSIQIDDFFCPAGKVKKRPSMATSGMLIFEEVSLSGKGRKAGVAPSNNLNISSFTLSDKALELPLHTPQSLPDQVCSRRTGDPQS